MSLTWLSFWALFLGLAMCWGLGISPHDLVSAL